MHLLRKKNELTDNGIDLSDALEEIEMLWEEFSDEEKMKYFPKNK